MIVFKVKNLNDIKTCREVEGAVKRFNEGKSFIWLPEYWVEAELVGESEERKTIIYVKDHFKIPDIQEIYEFLDERYCRLGAEKFEESLKDSDTTWIPSELLRIEVLENKKPSDKIESTNKTEPITLFKVKCDGMSPSMAFDLAAEVREAFSQELDKDTILSEIWVPDSLIQVERI